MDALYAAGLVGRTGQVIGVDFTLEQLEKARKLEADHGATWVEVRKGGSRSCRSPTRAWTA